MDRTTYTGGMTSTFAWVQTKSDVMLKVVLPVGVDTAAVDCAITASEIQVTVAGTKLMEGSLAATVVPEDCTWTIHRPQEAPDEDGPTEAETGCTVAVTLRKAKPALLTRLLASDASTEPRVLKQVPDTAQNTAPAPATKKELLADAKERVKQADMAGGTKSNYHMLEGLADDARVRVTNAEMPELPVLHVKNCHRCQITVPAGTSMVKLLVEGCSDCTLTVDGKITTDTVELWRSTRMHMAMRCRAATIQVDLSEEVTFAFDVAEHFERVVQAGARRLRLTFGDRPECDADVGLERIRQEHPETNDTTDQELVSEKLLRLKNDFPTTRREQLEFAEKVAGNAAVLTGEAERMLGKSNGLTLTDRDMGELEVLKARQLAAAAAARREVDEEVSDEARAHFKKTAGNEAFKEGNFQQAAFFYMQALELPSTPMHSVLHSNCAMCFLKLGQHDKALQHADAALVLDGEFAKSHFRRGLALQGLTRYADACGAFARAVELDPKNAQAKSAIQMCQMQLQRQARR